MGSLKPTYISIPESRGLTHTLTPTNPNIGTSDLITCVGVYLPISATRCFVAHINAYFDKPEAKSEFEKRWTTTEQGAQIREEVLRRLREHSQREGWSARDVVESGRKVVVMCPCYKDGKQGLRLSGVFVVEAIREFVGGVPVEEYFDNGLQKGFVVSHNTGEVHLLPQLWEVGPDGGEDRCGKGEDEGWIREEIDGGGSEEWHVVINP